MIKRFFSSLCALCLVPFITGCSSPTPADYANVKPTLDIREYMNGNFKAHGVIFDWRGRASRHFVATIKGTWNGNEGTLDEHFVYSDGTTDTRIWKLTFSDDTNFTGTAGDVVGKGVGSQQGNALNMKYVLRHKQEDGGTIDVTIDDWMYLTAEGVLLNKSKIYKFGIPVGELHIAFTRDDE
jgi:Protein of unknown function (DUF3833)